MTSPSPSPSQIPTLLLLPPHATARHPVSLSGDGGDELFGGYDRYERAAREWRRLDRWPSALRGAAGAAAWSLAGADWRPGRRLRRVAENLAYRAPEKLYGDYLTTSRPGDALAPTLAPPDTMFDAPLEAAPSLAQRFMLRDAMTYLPDDLLVKVDRASMHYGLEVRAPLLDHRIAEFAWSLPPALLFEGGGKRLLREVLYPPRAARHGGPARSTGSSRRSRAGLREGLRDWADELLAPARLAARGYVAPAIVAARWSAHRAGTRNWSRALWPVIMLEAWCTQNEGVASSRV